MKMTVTDYQALRAAVMAQMVLVEHGRMRSEYDHAGCSHERRRWDALWMSRYNTRHLYAYLNDDHVDTALRRIQSEASERVTV